MINKLNKKLLIIPSIAFIVTLFIVLILWNEAVKTNNKLIGQNVLQTGNLISKEFKNIIKADIARLQNLKQRIEFTNGTYFMHWEKDAEMLLEQNPSFKFLEWIDSTMVIRKITPLKGNENAIDLDISKIEYRRQEWINHSKDNSYNITPWAKLTQGGEAFLVDVPVYFNDRFQGTITGGMNFNANFNKLAASLNDHYSIELRDEKNTIFYELNGAIKSYTNEKFVFHDSILVDQLDNQKWRLEVYPSNNLFLAEGYRITNIALTTGFLLSFLISLLIYFYLRAREGARLALESNAKLLNTNETLNNERDRAEKASLAKTEFLANMSHEIRTPLHAILGFIELLKDSKLKKADQEYLDLMAKSSNNLLDIVNDILDIEKIESGKMELNQIEFRPSEKIKEIIEVNQFIFIKKNLYLEAIYNNIQDVKVIGDESKLAQVVNNIIKNGLKFTNTGGVTLTYNESLTENNELKVTINIKDTGIGIPEHRLNNIFERFTQLENIVKKQYEGSGLGLAISKIFVNMMGGEISVKSTIDKGSEFEFYICFKIVKQKTAKAVINYRKNINLTDLEVLIVDDNNLNIIVLKKFLEDIGIKPDIARNGKIALEKFMKKKYQLIFMDIHMPEMDGWEATNIIRKTNKEVIIFGLSANVTTQAIDKAMESGMNNYLSKPFKKEHLYRLLDFHFGKD